MTRIAIILSLACAACSGSSAPNSDTSVSDASVSDAFAPDASTPCTPGVYDVAAPIDAPYTVALGKRWVYWTTAVLNGPKGVHRAPRNGGDSEVVTTSTDDIAALAVDAQDTVYWIEAAPAVYGGSVRSRAETGEVRELYTLSTGTWVDPFAIAVDSIHVYWIVHDTSSFTDRVFRAPKDGSGVPAELGSVDLPFATTVRRMRLVDGQIYWGYSSGRVFSLSADGGTVSTLLNEPLGIGDFDVAAAFLFYLADEGSIMRMPLSGGEGETLAAGEDARFGIVVAGGVVFASTADDRLIALPGAGESAITVVDGGAIGTASIAVDDDYLFWSNSATIGAGGGVFRICAPDFASE